MRVGSSPVYFLPEQQPQLENFSQYLNQREKEALLLLNQQKLLEDSEQTPVIRVALRAITDFAIPVRIKIGSEPKLFWKYFTSTDEELESIFNEKYAKKVPPPQPAPPLQTLAPEIEKPPIAVVQPKQPEINQKIPIQTEIKEKPRTKAKKTKAKAEENDFGKKVKHHLSRKKVEVFEILTDKKKEFSAKVRSDHLFGTQEFYLTAKDKKSISDTDLSIALQKAQFEKMPALLLSNGDLNAKALIYLQTWKNLVKFEKITP